MLPTGGGAKATYDTAAAVILSNYLRMDSKLGPILNNAIPPGVGHRRAITEADGATPLQTRGMVNKNLRVERLYELPSTRIVKLDVSRGRSPVDMWEEPCRTAGEDAEILRLTPTATPSRQSAGCMDRPR